MSLPTDVNLHSVLSEVYKTDIKNKEDTKPAILKRNNSYDLIKD